MARDRVEAPMASTVVHVAVSAGQAVQAGQTLLVLEAMKMEHELHATHDAQVHGVFVQPGELVHEGDLLLQLAPSVGAAHAVRSMPADAAAPVLREDLREDLREVQARHALTLDAARPDAVAKRRSAGQRTAAVSPATRHCSAAAT